MGLRVPAVLAQTTILKVGVLLPLSGYLAAAGQSCQRALGIAAALLPEMGYKVEIVSADTESDTNVARSRAEQLIGAGAHVLVGAYDSGNTAAIAQVAEQHGVPLVINIAAAPQLTQQGYRTVFRNFPTSTLHMSKSLALIKELLRVSGTTPATAIALYPSDTFGQANKAALEAQWPALNIPFKILESITYDPKAQDLSIEVAKAKASGAELVIATTHAGDALALIREMVKQRYQPQGVINPGGPGFYEQPFYAALGHFSDYIISNVPWTNPRSELGARVAAQFKQLVPADPYTGHSFNVGFTFEAILVAADAGKRAGTTEPRGLLEALARTHLAERVMIGDAIEFDAQGQSQDIGVAAIQNRDGKPYVILPKDLQEREPVFPMPGWQHRA
jgi:branched-chain amino acid transport system substrate-binding protein